MAIKPEIQKLSDIALEQITIAEDGTPTFSDDAYEVLLKGVDEGLTTEQAEKVNKANVAITLAIGHAGGKKAIDAMEANKELQAVTGAFKSHGIEFKFNTLRTDTNRNPKTGETIESHGATSFGATLVGMKGAQTAAIKSELKALAAERRLGGK